MAGFRGLTDKWTLGHIEGWTDQSPVCSYVSLEVAQHLTIVTKLITVTGTGALCLPADWRPNPNRALCQG